MITTVFTVMAVVGLGVTTGLWQYNVNQLYDKDKQQQQRIAELEAQIQAINASLPAGNGTVFFDDTWVMANGAQPGRKFMFDAGQITVGTKETFIWPNVSGTVALQQTLPPAQTVFPEDEFAITGVADSRRIEFDLSLLTPGAFRLYSTPNKNGVLALISDVVAIAGNTSVFSVASFGLIGDPDTSIHMMFSDDLLQTDTNYTYIFPDAQGADAELVSTGGAQTLSGKTLDDSNTIEVVDSNLAILGTGGGNAAFFDANALSSDRTFDFPNVDMTFIGREGSQWSTTSLGMSNAAGSYDNILLVATSDIDRFFRFRTGGGGNPGSAGITLSAFDDDSYSLAAVSNGDHDFTIFWNATAPSAYDELGIAVFSISGVTQQTQLHNPSDPASYATFDVSGLSAVRTLAIPNKAGTIALISDVVAIASNTSVFSVGSFALMGDPDTSILMMFSDDLLQTDTNYTYIFPDVLGADAQLVAVGATQTLSNKTLDNSNSLTVLDSNFAVENGGNQMVFDLSAYTSTRTISMPNIGGTPLIRASTSVVTTAGSYLFLDNEAQFADEGDTSKRVRFGLAGMATGATVRILGVATADRDQTLPDLDGTFLLDSGAQTVSDKTLDNSNSITVLYSNFALENVGGDAAQIDASGLTANRNYALPNKDGTFAMISDVNAIAGNTSVFSVGSFALIGDPDTTIRMMFSDDLLQTDTNYTYAFPDVLGADAELVAIGATQTLSNKTLDNSNSITVLDSNFAVENAGNQLTFDLSSYTSNRNVFWPNDGGTVFIRRSDNVVNAGGGYYMLDIQAQFADNADTTKRVRFSLGLATTGTTITIFSVATANRDQTLPDLTGTFLLDSGAQTVSDKTLDNSNSITVLYSNFALENVGGDAAQIDASGLTANRNYALPNKDGTFAMISDVNAIAGNTSVFSVGSFALIGDPDTTIRMMFSDDLLQTDTNYTYAFPDVQGADAELVTTGGAQTLSDKTLDESNVITINDNALTIINAASPTNKLQFDVPIWGGVTRTWSVPNLSSDGIFLGVSTLGFVYSGTDMYFNDNRFRIYANGDTSRKLAFDASGVTGTRTWTVPDADMTVVGQSSNTWSTNSLGMTGGAGSYDSITLAGTTEIDRFFRYRTGGGSPNGRAGVTLSSFDGDSYSIFAESDGSFRVAHNTTLPSGYGELGTTVISIDDSTDQFRIHKQVNDAIYLAFDVTALSTAHTVGFPDSNGQVALIAATQTLSNKVLDNSNSITVEDINLNIENAGGDAMSFDAGNLTADRTQTFQDKDCTLACLSDTQAPQRFFAQRTTNQAIPDSTTTIAIFPDDTTPPMNDVSGMYDNSTGVATIAVEGYYNIACWVAIVAGSGKYFVRIYINGDGSNLPEYRILQGPTSSGYPSFSGGATLLSAFLQVGDTVTIRVEQNSGSNKNLVGGTFSMNRVA